MKTNTNEVETVSDGFDYNALIEDYTQTEGTFTIELANGKVLTAKHLPDGSAYTRLQVRGKLLAKQAKTNPLTQWKPFLPVSDELIFAAVFLEATLVPKMPFATGLKMAKNCGPLLQHIFNKVSAVVYPFVVEQAAVEIDEEKNG